MHMAICLWGLMRSSRYTIDSYDKFIIEPIAAMNHTYEVFVHTYRLNKPYSSARNRENPTQINESDWHLLKPNYVFVEDQDVFDHDVNYLLYESKGDPWDNDYVSFKSHMRALNSLNHITMVLKSLCQRKNKGLMNHTNALSYCFDAVVFLRPDVQFLHPLPVHLLIRISSNTLYVPDFHRSCKRPELNDRMAMGGLQAALAYGTRFQSALAYSEKHELHAERFAYGHMIKYKDVEVVEIPFRFRRVRSNGQTNERDETEVSAPYILQSSNNTYECSYSAFTLLGLLESTGRFFYLSITQIYDTVSRWVGNCRPNLYLTPNDVYFSQPFHCLNKGPISKQAQANKEVKCKYRYEHFYPSISREGVERRIYSDVLVPISCKYHTKSIHSKDHKHRKHNKRHSYG